MAIHRTGRSALLVSGKETCCLGRLTYGLLALLLLVPAIAAKAQDAEFDLQAALNDARPGATIAVPAGVYAGPITVHKPVTLIGEGWPVIQGSGHGDVITVTAPDVTVQGFVIRNSGDQLDRENAGITGLAPRLTVLNNRLEETLFGIYLKEAPNSVIQGNSIRSKDLPLPRRGDGIRAWYSDGVLVQDNTVQGSRDVVIWFSPHGVIRGNRVENGRYGLHFMFSDDQLVEDNILDNNSVGAFLMYGHGLTLRNNLLRDNHGPSGYGIGLKDVDNVIGVGNRLVGNRVGAYVDNSPREPSATLRFTGNLFAYNEVGLEMLPLVKRNTYAGNLFLDNGEQVAIVGSGTLSGNRWSADGRGNYWSDYRGFDADGDGIGDLPYAPESLYESLTGSHPELRLFQLSPATDALDLAARTFPVFKPRAKMEDGRPLMRPPVLPALDDTTAPSRGFNLAVAAGLLIVSLGTLLGATYGQRRRQRRLARLFPAGV